MELSGSDVVAFVMADGAKVVVRPSGTEPKMKVYIMGSEDAANKYSRWAETLAE